MTAPTLLDVAKQMAAEGKMGHTADVLIGFCTKFARSKKGRRLKSGQWWKRQKPPPRSLVRFRDRGMDNMFQQLRWVDA